jgi:hypothetical protein
MLLFPESAPKKKIGFNTYSQSFLNVQQHMSYFTIVTTFTEYQ